ncbi:MULTISPECIES: LysR substrate-binding domain-containing protein [unclassified Streptomyces]|uniref:LysR substrate-binding domain-containing protein n=1 Tax=unclassified Streptomyces TaxID=2593676 RepID=UPI00093F15F7|nr:LysR substrate-binding domain-containing protein [Streptomyces sp. TSRI0281]OKI43463.1 LysR family transcriptional regulator [Streptomyces sp. TSRI0281]
MDLLDGRLKFRHLTLLVAIVDHGSVVRAAESLHLTQPAATRTLRELEGIADLPLFVREPRGMRATLYGEALTEHARAVLAEMRRAEERLTALRQGREGTVTVGALLAGTNVLLPRAVAQLKRDRPGLTVVVREGTPDVLHPALLSGELDVVVGRVGPAPREGDGLRQRRLYRERIRLAVRAGHPLLETADVALTDTLGFPWILPVEQTALRQELGALFVDRGLTLPSDRVECTSFLTMRALLVQTDMVALLPELVLRADEHLAALPVELPSVGRTVGTTEAAHRTRTPALQALLHHLDHEAALLRETLHGPPAEG